MPNDSENKLHVVENTDFQEEKKVRNNLWRIPKISALRLLPSALTIFAMFLGFASIQFAFLGRFELVVGLIFISAVLDMLDGRVARFVSQESRIGAQLDSLADFLNFGIAPAFAAWHWNLKEFGDLGWGLAFLFTLCCALRLARFNASLEEDEAYSKKYFQGVPAPAAGLLLFMPMVMSFLGIQNEVFLDTMMLIFTIGVALLMVSSIPTFSAKNLRLRFPRTNFVPVLLGASFVSVLAFNFPFVALLLLGVAYLASIPWTIYCHYYSD